MLQALVQLLDPTLDTAEMERLAALLAVPQGAALVDRVMADHALFYSLSE